MKQFIAAVAITCAAAFAHAKDFNVREFGATGDGATLDSAAVQQAIDAAHAAGGGTVTVPRGTFLCGTILLTDNVTLHLDDGAEIRGTTDLAQYRNLDPFLDGLGASIGRSFVTVIDAKNVAITGRGTFHGNGRAVAAAVAASQPASGRVREVPPMLLRVVRSERVTVRDVTFRDSAAWTTNYFQSKHVTIENVTIDSHVTGRNDGINIDSCSDFTITNCDVYSGDDALVLKSTSNTPCRNITASNLKLRSNHGAIKLGTESLGGFERIRISNCQIRDTRNGGIKLLCVDGGTLSDVVISDITMDNVRTPIFVRLGARLKTFRPGDAKKPVGALKDVVIRNVKAKAAADAQLMPPTGIFITGIPDYRIEGLTLENIEIDLAGGGTAEHARAVVEENIAAYPEIDRFGRTLPAWGIFMRHAKGVKLKDIKLNLAAADLRPAVVCHDVADVVCSGWSLPAASDAAESVVRLESAADVSFQGIQFGAVGAGRARCFVRVEGKASRGIIVPDQAATDQVALPFELGDGVTAEAVSQR